MSLVDRQEWHHWVCMGHSCITAEQMINAQDCLKIYNKLRVCPVWEENGMENRGDWKCLLQKRQKNLQRPQIGIVVRHEQSWQEATMSKSHTQSSGSAPPPPRAITSHLSKSHTYAQYHSCLYMVITRTRADITHYKHRERGRQRLQTNNTRGRKQ